MPKIIISGGITIDQEINEDNELSAAFMRMAVKSVTKSKADDNLTYRLDNLGEIIIKQGDIVVKTKQKDNTAQKIRGSLWYIWSDEGITENFDDWYNKQKGKLINYMPEIWQMIKNKN